MLALRFMPLAEVTAIVWVAPVLVTALSGVLLHERVTPAAWASVITGLIGVRVIIGLRGGGVFAFHALSALGGDFQCALSDYDPAFA